MLRKLIKYELKSTARTFFPMYAILLLAALFTRLFTIGPNNGMYMEHMHTASTVSITVVSCMFVAVGVATLIWIIQRFNKNLLQDEGYLMFTLPVKSSTLINAKLISAFIWMTVASIVASIAIGIIIIDGAFMTELQKVLPLLWQQLTENWVLVLLYTIQWIFFSIFSISASLLMIYCSLSVGQLPIFAKHRTIFAFLTFIVITTVIETFISVIAWNTGLFDSMYQMLNTFYYSTNIDLTLIPPMIGSLILSVILFFATKLILDKKLNLE